VIGSAATLSSSASRRHCGALRAARSWPRLSLVAPRYTGAAGQPGATGEIDMVVLGAVSVIVMLVAPRGIAGIVRDRFGGTLFGGSAKTSRCSCWGREGGGHQTGACLDLQRDRRRA
jgi:hypothetical protein